MKIKIVRSIREINKWAEGAAYRKGTCGFVPTLGSLHEGHVSLIKKAGRENGKVVVSVFVNPLQFKKNQYHDYPRNLKNDARVAEKAGADILFAPLVDAIYPNGFETGITLPKMFNTIKKQKLEWHYRGVLVVVAKLLNLVRPHHAYFGRKDPHQLALIEKMVEELNIPVKIRGCPTVREPDGLARSSRNALLSPAGRKTAPVIYRALVYGKKEIQKKGMGAVSKTISQMRRLIIAAPLTKPEHLEIVDAKSLEPLKPGSREAMAFVSVWIGKQRLTDNIRFRLK